MRERKDKTLLSGCRQRVQQREVGKKNKEKQVAEERKVERGKKEAPPWSEDLLLRQLKDKRQVLWGVMGISANIA